AAGDYEEALRCLAMLTGFDSSKAWASGGWLARPDVAERIDPQVALRALVSFTGDLPDPAGDELTRTLMPFLEFARRLVTAHPSAADLLCMLSGLARRLGAVDEAIGWCERAEVLSGSSMSAVMLGYAYRRADRAADTLAAWQRALERDPGNLALHVDI